jgi:alpha-amylase/alpha-mannosidase (GH57 family)
MNQIVVHAHCYQPPREEPWLDLVPREPSAAPDHDWNTRITRECYRPLSHARVLDPDNRTLRVYNAWEWLSFDVGPTLVTWLERHAPDVLDAMRAGDRAAIARTDFGTAVAHPYHHVILPLASRRDKRTEVRWGIHDFRRVFGRDPLTMWLPETALDEETLEVVLGEGIRGVIVAPHQVRTVSADGRPVPWRHGTETLWLLPYDGALAHAVALARHSTMRDAGQPASQPVTVR